MLAEKLNDQPVGRALSAIDILYQDLDDMELRLDILIARIGILKKRTEALSNGDFGTLKTLLGTLDNKKSAPAAPQNVPNDSSPEGDSEPSVEQEIEWERLKILSETTINDIVLTAESVVSLERKAAEKLIGEGIASKIEEQEAEKKPESETTPETEEETEAQAKSEDS